MPTKLTVNAASLTAGVSFLQLALNNQNVPLSRDGDGNISGTKVMTLPDSFPGVITIKAILPTDWKLSLSIQTIPDKDSVLSQDITGTIGDNLEDHWTGQLNLSPPAPALTASKAKVKAGAKAKMDTKEKRKS
jgi:hypothetical protein